MTILPVFLKSVRKAKTKLALLFFTSLYLFSSTAIPAFANRSYTYDANGNMTSDGAYCYTYNDANQVSQVKNCSNNQVIAQYIYDYQGNRIEKKLYTNGVISKTVYSPDKSYETSKLANGTTQNISYYYVNDELVAKKNPDGSKNYYLADNLHSTSVLTDQSGTVVENSTYYPYGDIRSGGTKSKYLYTGQESDSETNLDYYNARYYYSHIRRFTQPDDVIADPYNPQELNRYSYVNNNPLTYSDPSGHCVEDLCIGESAVLVAAPVILAVGGYEYAVNPSFKRSVNATTSKVAQGAMNNWQNFWGQVNNFFDNRGNDKKTPNPYGKNGGPEHQNTINNLVEELQAKGYDIEREFKVDTPGGYKQYRFGDIYAKSPDGQEVIYQVGRQTKSGLPVAREVKAIEDILNHTKGIKVEFRPYNK